MGCAVWHGWTEVRKFPDAPVLMVSLELEAGQVLQEDPVEPEAVEHLHTAIAAALLRNGITVVGKGEHGAPALIGDIEKYYEGDDGGPTRFGYRRGMFRIAWRLVDGNGAILGRCVTDADSGLGPGAVDYTAILEGTGDGLANFLKRNRRA